MEHRLIPTISIISAIIGMLGGIPIGILMRHNQISDLKEEAVKRNYAEWKVDNPKNGTTIFTWK